MAQRSGKTCDWLWALLLVFAVVAAYQPVWFAGFIWDDDAIVTGNAVITGPLGLKEIWTTKAADICPLTLTTFWIEYRLWGANPLFYHLVNVIMQAGCAVLLWRVLLRLRIPGAWLGAALWALHPVQAESVAWIAEMKNTQSGLFYLLTILFFARGLEEGGRGKGTYALTLFFAALAMASKSSTVILPVVLCLCAWWKEGRWSWSYPVKIAPIFLMAIVTGLVSMWTQQIEGANDPQWARSWPERIAGAGEAVWFYLGKLAWPHPLVTIYPRSAIDSGNYFSAVAVVLVLGGLWWSRKTFARPWFFAFAYFVIALLPSLGLLRNYAFRYSMVFDHLQYLASIGPLALTGAGLVWVADRFVPEEKQARLALAGVVVLGLGTLTWFQAWIYENKWTLWSDTAAKNPNCAEAYNNLGIVLIDSGRTDEAIPYFKKAIEVDSKNPEAEYNLGVIFMGREQLDEAVDHFRRAVAFYPDYANAQNNLGSILVRQGKLDEAGEHFRRALQVVPDWPGAHSNLGAVYARKGQLDDAISEFKAALATLPTDINARRNLGSAYLQKGLVDDAIAQFRIAESEAPDVAAIHYVLGHALLQKGEIDGPIAEYQEALRLQPDYPQARSELAQAQEMAKHKPTLK